MKKYIYSLLILCGISLIGWSQTPKQFNYQAVVWDENNQLVVDKDMEIILSILQGSADGKVVYEMREMVHTNSNGLLSVEVGKETVIRGVDWAKGPFFIQAKPAPGYEQYVMASTRQIVSVPYAMYAEVVDSVRGLDIKEHQVLTKHKDTVFLTGGSYIIVPESFDGDYNHLSGEKPSRLSEFANDLGFLTEEHQVLWMRGDTIFLTGGSYVVIPEDFGFDYENLRNRPVVPTHVSQLDNDMGFIFEEVQVLSARHDTIFLTGGSFVKMPYITEVQTLADVVSLGNRAGNRQLKDLKDPTELQDVITVDYLDSVMDSVHVTIGDPTHHTYTITTCDSYLWYGTNYTTSGLYTHSYANGGGFYCVDTLKLTIKHGTFELDSVRSVESYTWHNEVYYDSDTIVYNYYNRDGCPSSDTLYLTIDPIGTPCKSYRMETDTAVAIACGWINWYGSILYNSGVYEHSLGNIAQNGCDSVMKVTINILPSFRQDTIARTSTALIWRGHTYTQQGDYGDTLLAANGCDSLYVLHLMIGGSEGIGATPGIFSVANGVQVRFAQGNLMYQSSSNHWKFSENQYDNIRVKCPSSNYSDWADLFGWATSGYHDASDTLCKYYYPWAGEIVPAEEGSDAAEYNQYGYGPSLNGTEFDLVNSNAYYDWGVYNPIINGGNGAGLWRMLSKDEWDYLLNRRHNARYLRSLGSIQNVKMPTGGSRTIYGYIIMGDNWVRPNNIEFRPNSNSYYANSYSITEWNDLEASGAVFLPIGTDYEYNGYWTSTHGGVGGAYALMMDKDTMVVAPYNRSNSYSVRLVQEYQAGVNDCNCTYMDTTIVSDGTFSWHGYSYSNPGDYLEVIVNSSGCDSIISLNLLIEEPGILNGQFSVSASKKIQFSKGNLQYKPKANLWRFAEEQYGYIGEANRFKSEDYNGWIDLFCWATSGYHDSTDLWNSSYYPWSTYGDGPSLNMCDVDIVNTSKNYDWGVYNAVANGGNVVGRWRVLTYEEWNYMLNERNSASLLRGNGMVHKEHGLIILPDNWTAPAGILFDPNSDSNIYNDVQWKKMETAGAVFLPCAGYMSGSGMNHIGIQGGYWSSSFDKESIKPDEYYNWVWYLYISTSSGYMSTTYKDRGASVRLVKDY